MKFYKFHTLSFISIVIIFLSCSKNPFSESKFDTSTSQVIKGTIQYEDQSVANNVFVWLEGLNISTFSDGRGEFQLELPAPNTQPGGGLSGVYKIYYFVENCVLMTSTLGLANGKVAHDKEDIDENGNVRNVVVLKQLLSIKTVLKKKDYYYLSGTQGAIEFHTGYNLSVTLNPQVSGVKIRTYMVDNDMASYYVLENDSPLSSAIKIGQGNSILVFKTLHSSLTMNMLIYNSKVFENSQVIPYVKVVREDLPTKLVESLGLKGLDFNNDFLKIPYKREFKIDNNSEKRNLWLGGKVSLSDNIEPDSVYLWLSGNYLNRSTYSDKSGNFEILLPSPFRPDPSILNGEFKLYYYLANYTIDSTIVRIENNQFVYNMFDVNGMGFTQDKILQKLLDIKTTVEPGTIKAGDSLNVTVSLRPVNGNAVTVETMLDEKGLPTSGFIISHYPNADVVLTTNGGNSISRLISGETMWKMTFKNTFTLTPGSYIFIPYILIQQKGLPANLLRQFGEFSNIYHEDFLNIPVKQQNGRFQLIR